MDKKILDGLKSLQKNVAKIQADMVTVKADMVTVKADMVTVKADMVTKQEAKKFVTRDDANNFATKTDLNNLATKNDLKKLRTDISDDIGGVVNELIADLDNKKADRIELEYLEERVKIVERKVVNQ